MHDMKRLDQFEIEVTLSVVSIPLHELITTV
jgi:hypothetical protein